MKYLCTNSEGIEEQRDIEVVEVTVQLSDDQSVTRPIYPSHFGPSAGQF